MSHIQLTWLDKFFLLMSYGPHYWEVASVAGCGAVPKLTDAVSDGLRLLLAWLDDGCANVMEQVVLVDDAGRPNGAMAKSLVHSASTPLHLAFSCYVFNDDGQLLLSRRALSKSTWPGVWTNSFCGHPQPGETIAEAIHRRADQELGVRVRQVSVAAPEFRYRAVDASGIVENEICPVYTASLDSALAPNPAELMQWEWIDPTQLRAAALAAPFAFSPWMIEQLPLLRFPVEVE